MLLGLNYVKINVVGLILRFISDKEREMMARTKTKKILLKAERSGVWSSVNNRRSNEDYGAISQHVRVTPSKQQKLNKIKHKERITYDGAPFLCPFMGIISLHSLSAEHSELFG